jgi:CheY-like chemotaxis protein/CRP-like cAMP-binding protein
MANKILVLEDDEAVRLPIVDLLEAHNYEVITAEDGQKGIELAGSSKPDLILSDIMMPNVDGYGVFEALQQDPLTAVIPFIFLTAKAEMTDLRRGMNLGADDYLTKPFDEVELLDAIEMRLKKSEILNQSFDKSIKGLDQFFNEARSHEALSKLSEDREIRIYRPKDVIFTEGSYPRGLLFVSRGKVKTYKTNEDAKDYITDLFKVGDFLGHTALLSGSPYQESAMALEETEVSIIPKEDFFALMWNNRDVANKFIKLLADSLQEKEERLLHLAYDSVRKRVADALLTLQERYDSQNGDGHFSMSISRENLASMVGTSKECVIRVLSDFKEDKMVKTHLSEITITDKVKLERVRY